jgi:hypothetical protein
MRGQRPSAAVRDAQLESKPDRLTKLALGVFDEPIERSDFFGALGVVDLALRELDRALGVALNGDGGRVVAFGGDDQTLKVGDVGVSDDHASPRDAFRYLACPERRERLSAPMYGLDGTVAQCGNVCRCGVYGFRGGVQFSTSAREVECDVFQRGSS